MSDAAGEIDMVQWDDGTHEILAYNDDNGRGLTRCTRPIGPWDIWLVGVITCGECVKKRERRENEQLHQGKGPKEWFPKDAPGETKPPAPAPGAQSSDGDSLASILYLSCG